MTLYVYETKTTPWRQMSTIICPVRTMSGGEHVVYCGQTVPEECITCKAHPVLSHHYNAHRVI